MIFRDFSTESLTGWCMGMQCIWKRQNSRVWNGEELLVHVSFILAKDMLRDWTIAQQSAERNAGINHKKEVTTWQKPPADT
jgi:hypothetical protein